VEGRINGLEKTMKEKADITKLKEVMIDSKQWKICKKKCR